MNRHSDKRLEQLVRQALLAIEDPAKGIVFDDFIGIARRFSRCSRPEDGQRTTDDESRLCPKSHVLGPCE